MPDINELAREMRDLFATTPADQHRLNQIRALLDDRDRLIARVAELEAELRTELVRNP